MTSTPDRAPETTSSGLLSDRDREILELEKRPWAYDGSKEQVIRDKFGLSSTQYYQVLNRLIDTEAAIAAEPMVVKRLRRRRAQRQKQRTARRLGIEI